jgi:hypothetical protein
MKKLQTEGPSQVYLSFGPECRLFSEEHFLAQLQPLGMSRRGFRAWCRAMSVPLIHMPGNKVFVDIFSFRLAMRAISRIGQPDFLCPSSAARLQHKAAKFPCTTRLDIEYVRDNWQTLVSELLAARLDPSAFAMKDVRDAASSAAERMVLAAVAQRPILALAMRDGKIRAEAERRGWLKPMEEKPCPEA